VTECLDYTSLMNSRSCGITAHRGCPKVWNGTSFCNPGARCWLHESDVFPRRTLEKWSDQRGCFRTPSSKRHLGFGKGHQEECLDQACLWTGLPEGEVLTMQSLLSIMLSDGHWMEEAEAEPNAWKATAGTWKRLHQGVIQY
jgi:hypothetical protein